MKGRRIILGVSGGIAAYKSVFLLRELQKAGAEVRVVMTPSATRFVGLETFEALSRNPVPVHVFNAESGDDGQWSRHIQWAEWAELLVIAPCTANTLGKLVHGLSDNMLTTTALAVRCPLLICPTMDGGMFRAPAMQQNLKLADELGFHVMNPEAGYLASGLYDEGRLPEVPEILAKIDSILPKTLDAKPLLAGKKVLITAGPTREFIDAVRFISNPSSGKMGVALALAAQQMGATVKLIHGKLGVTVPGDLQSSEIVSASDLFEAVKKEHAWADVIIMAAAVSDFTPDTSVAYKIKKTETQTSIQLKPTTDILHWLGTNRLAGQTLVGFAMETDNLEAEVTRKRISKQADWIAGNLLNAPGSGFEGDDNAILLQGATESHLIKGSKTKVAIEMLERIFQ